MYNMCLTFVHIKSLTNEEYEELNLVSFPSLWLLLSDLLVVVLVVVSAVASVVPGLVWLTDLTLVQHLRVRVHVVLSCVLLVSLLELLAADGAGVGGHLYLVHLGQVVLQLRVWEIEEDRVIRTVRTLEITIELVLDKDVLNSGHFVIAAELALVSSSEAAVEGSNHKVSLIKMAEKLLVWSKG